MSCAPQLRMFGSSLAQAHNRVMTHISTRRGPQEKQPEGLAEAPSGWGSRSGWRLRHPFASRDCVLLLRTNMNTNVKLCFFWVSLFESVGCVHRQLGVTFALRNVLWRAACAPRYCQMCGGVLCFFFSRLYDIYHGSFRLLNCQRYEILRVAHCKR